MKAALIFLNIFISLLLIILDIIKPILGIIKLFAYLPLITLIVLYFGDHLTLKTGINLGISSVILFTIFYGYFFIINFLVGFKQGLNSIK